MSGVVDGLKKRSLTPDNAEVSMVPANYTELDEDAGATILRLIDALEELDDVQNVYSNADFPEGIMEG